MTTLDFKGSKAKRTPPSSRHRAPSSRLDLPTNPCPCADKRGRGQKQSAISIAVTQRGDFGDFRPFRDLSSLASHPAAAWRRNALERSPHVLKQQLDIMMTRHRMLRNHAIEPSSNRCSISTTFPCVPQGREGGRVEHDTCEATCTKL